VIRMTGLYLVGAWLVTQVAGTIGSAGSLSGLKNRSENSTGRGQISSILKGNSASIAQESGGIWTVQANLQPISFKSDRLLGVGSWRSGRVPRGWLLPSFRAPPGPLAAPLARLQVPRPPSAVSIAVSSTRPLLQ